MAGSEGLLVLAEAEVYESESREKVARALQNVFGSTTVEINLGERTIRATCKGNACLQRLKFEARTQRIRAALRRLLSEHVNEGATWVYLNKQAAYAGRLVPCEVENESPLGPIKLTLIYEGDIKKIIEELTA
ncbi:MAG: hypothetical protein C4339_01025 [Nitrososphaerota archaeon]